MKKSNRVCALVVSVFFLSGAMLHAATPPKNVISKEKAQSAAVKKYPGEVKEGELEHEEGKWIYSFDIIGKDKKIHEVWVDAKSGRIVKHKVESAGEEAKESQHKNNP